MNPDQLVVEIFENQTKSSLSGAWYASTDQPWTSKDGKSCKSPEEFQLPSSGDYCWTSNWKLEKNDSESWEYASRYSRFGTQDRNPKSEARWNDSVRRRVWSRTMRKEFSAGSGVARLQMADMSRIIPRMQHGLEKINEARRKIEMIMKQAPHAAQNEQMLLNVISVRKTIADITSILEQLERAQGPGSAHIAHIKKLRREVTKEEIAIEKALYPNGSSNGSHKFPPLSKTGSGNLGGRESFSARSSSGLHASESCDSISSNSGRERLSGSTVKSGNKGAFSPSLFMNGEAGNGDGVLYDGVFVDQSTHERMISQKLHPVDEATVMQEIIEERNHEISKMHKGIVEINEMFVDLSRIVGEQGHLIDAIWSNVDEGNSKTKDAFKHIVQADKLQRKGNCMIQ